MESFLSSLTSPPKPVQPKEPQAAKNPPHHATVASATEQMTVSKADQAEEEKAAN